MIKHIIYIEVNEELTDKEIGNLHNFIKANPKVEHSYSMRDTT